MHGGQGPRTLLYDSLAAIEREFPREADRRSILAFTDAIDEGSTLPAEQLNQVLMRGTSTLYTIMPTADSLHLMAKRFLGTNDVLGRVPYSMPGRRGIWVIHLDESDEDPAGIAMRRQAANRLLDKIPSHMRIWMLRTRKDGTYLLGMKGFSAAGKEPQPLTVAEAREAINEPDQPPREPGAQEKRKKGSSIRIEGEREAFITNPAQKVTQSLRPHVPPGWIARRTLIPEYFSNQADLDAAIEIFVKDPKAYTEMLTDMVEGALQMVRGNLIMMAENTGGVALEFRKPSDLGDSYDRIAQRIKASYTLGYYTNASRGRHPLRVVVADPDLDVRSRKVLVLEP